MKVCDTHKDTEAVDTIYIEGDGTHIDICDRCKYDVLSFFAGNHQALSNKKTLFQKIGDTWKSAKQ